MPLAIVGVVPGILRSDCVEAVGYDKIAAGVELLRVVALPPLPCTVSFGQRVRVVAHVGHGSGGVVSVRSLEPVPGVRAVVADAEPHAVGARDTCPCADDVAHGTDARRVPPVITRGVVIEVIVMVGERKEVLCTGGLVQLHQLFGLPLIDLPQVIDLHEAEL